ncbi:hypothetical protein R3P38DRAFT_3150423 [Favolaschia claudopus]|uniref:Uncharacterized protein n=1 Tax=Favolaschia claudopus TaxID=2862362 RepID=A0AAV9Z311_9AGAR
MNCRQALFSRYHQCIRSSIDFPREGIFAPGFLRLIMAAVVNHQFFALISPINLPLSMLTRFAVLPAFICLAGYTALAAPVSMLVRSVLPLYLYTSAKRIQTLPLISLQSARKNIVNNGNINNGQVVPNGVDGNVKQVSNGNGGNVNVGGGNVQQSSTNNGNGSGGAASGNLSQDDIAALLKSLGIRAVDDAAADDAATTAATDDTDDTDFEVNGQETDQAGFLKALEAIKAQQVGPDSTTSPLSCSCDDCLRVVSQILALTPSSRLSEVETMRYVPCLESYSS